MVEMTTCQRGYQTLNKVKVFGSAIGNSKINLVFLYMISGHVEYTGSA